MHTSTTVCAIDCADERAREISYHICSFIFRARADGTAKFHHLLKVDRRMRDSFGESGRENVENIVISLS